VLALVAVGPLLTGCGLVSSSVRGDRHDGRAGATEASAAVFPASDVLRGWDRARGRAFASGDTAALRRLYVAGSSAGTSDVRLLRSYLAQGFTVEGMRMQVLALEVLHEDSRRLRLLVTDRLVGAVAVGRGSRVPLPADQASTRVVDLRRAAPEDPWRVASVRASSRRPAAR
jgi:hypothetical protein